MSWTYEQLTGRLLDANGAVVATGYAGGNCGKNPEGRNNPDMQGCRSIGPLPEGLYRAGKVVLTSHLGPFAIPLIPSPINDMRGRSAFYMHGDRKGEPGSASEGCIIMPRAVRERFYSTDPTLRVIRGGIESCPP